MKYFLLVVIATVLVGCRHEDEPRAYFNAAQHDSLLADIITYIYVRPPGATWETRFEPQYRKYYVTLLPRFSWKKAWRDQNGWYYFYIIRPARSAEGAIRGVGGMFKLDKNGKIKSFKEVFNTPVGAITRLEEIGAELFNYMKRHGNVDAYLLNDAYLEWPTAWTYYDTIRHEWRSRPGF